MNFEHRPYAPEASELDSQLFSAVLDALPDLNDQPSIDPHQQVRVIGARSFDELYVHKDGFREYKTVLNRNRATQNRLQQAIQWKDDIGYSPLEVYIQQFLEIQKVLLAHNHYPYDVPPDTHHLVAWYRENTPGRELAVHLAEKFDGYRIGSSDFIIYKNIPQRQSVRNIHHLHILARKR